MAFLFGYKQEITIFVKGNHQVVLNKGKNRSPKLVKI